jgi:cobyrinic acid a,c-diamide synthase
VTARRGLLIAAAASHSGKTTVTLGLIATLKARGHRVAAAKCGPDYIDPKFLEAASGRPAVNLDPWAMCPERLRALLARQASDADLVIVEGVMGLYDGGPGGAGSTASLAALTGLPVLLVVGAKGLAQSAAAVAEGCARLAENFCVAGAIVNQVASERHPDLVREGFARASVPLFGLVRRDPAVALPSRHLGLVQAQEHADLAERITRAGELIAQGCDLDGILRAATPTDSPPPQGGRGRLAPLGQTIAVARDVAFAFAYPHLLADWRASGAKISFFSPLADEGPAAEADAVFLPGGYPELHAGRLGAAAGFQAGMHAAAERGALIYGECGGYMVLGDSLTDAEGQTHSMLGLLPVATSFAQKKLHLGYRRLRPLSDLPWAALLAAHEFHFASILHEGGGERLFSAEDAAGRELGLVGLRRGRVMGSFAHVIDGGA